MEDSNMVPASTDVSTVGCCHKYGCHKHLSPWRKFQLPPASLGGGSARSGIGPGPGNFQTAASVLGLGASEFLHAPFKSRVQVSYSFLVLLNVNPAGFQSQTF